jgi:hypothetical protein
LGFPLKDFRDSITLRQGRDNAFIMFLREEGEGSDLYCSYPEIQEADMVRRNGFLSW